MKHHSLKRQIVRLVRRMMRFVQQRQSGGACPGTGASCIVPNVTYTTNQTVGAIQQFFGLIKDVVTFIPDINAQMGKAGGPMIS
jgi:hypothetical protein